MLICEHSYVQCRGRHSAKVTEKEEDEEYLKEEEDDLIGAGEPRLMAQPLSSLLKDCSSKERLAESNIDMTTNTGSLIGGDIEAGNFNRQVSNTEIKTSPIEAHNLKMADGGYSNLSSSDTEKWASSLESMLEDVPNYMCNPGHPGRICRIPENLREVDRNSYEPCYLWIGPYHHGKTSLQCVEKTKWEILKHYLEQRPEITLKYVLKEIKSIEKESRCFYSDVDMESEKFVQMLLLDSLYLVIVFCGWPKSRGRINPTNTKYCCSADNEGNIDGVNKITDGFSSLDDIEDTQLMETVVQFNSGMSGENNINGVAWFWTMLVHDLFLVENQLPFFVLEKMHYLVYGDSETQLKVTLTSLFQKFLLDYVKLDSEILISPTKEIHHLLHLCHMFFRPTLQQDLTTCQHHDSSQMFRLDSAVQLYEAGITFEAKSCSTQYSLLDITFSSSRKMVMPCLHVDDNTNSLLRNLIALEQMKYPSMGLNVSAYAVLLLHLVTKPEDVKLLRGKRIIHHHLASDKEMMYLINRLSMDLAFDYVEDEYCLKPVIHELKRLSNNRVPRWRALLKHRYFKNPWTAISLMAASLFLLLTAVQTYYAVYSYYHPYVDDHL